jgi:predicted small secreted protein
MKSTFAIGAILATAAAAFGVHYLYKTKYKKTGDAE